MYEAAQTDKTVPGNLIPFLLSNTICEGSQRLCTFIVRAITAIVRKIIESQSLSL